VSAAWMKEPIAMLPPSAGRDPANRHLHLVGIGGAGLSAIARVLLEKGYQVSGSDLAAGPATDTLSELGATIYTGHASHQVQRADMVLVSSAIPADNLEVKEALRLGIPVVRRPEFLGWLTTGKEVIAVAGTHGKTTTTAMIAWALTRAGRDPTYIVGGLLPQLGSNAHAGTGSSFVIEADEYDRTFLGLNPQVAVVTTIEWDHVDCYATPEDCSAAFLTFANLLPPGGLLVVCADDAMAGELGVMRRVQGSPVLTYGTRKGTDWWARRLRSNALGGSDFSVWRKGRRIGPISLQVPGRHNVLNTLAALAVIDHMGVPFDVSASALREFGGVRRRFELKGVARGVDVLDDYAHHPTEIRATLSAARQRFPGRSIWAVFQPHTYSRTRALLDDFATSFSDADHLIVTDIYAARERDTKRTHAVQIIERMDHADARHIGGLREATEYLLERLQAGDVLITLGAGDGYQVGEWVLAGLSRGDGKRDATSIAE
jgi:UDP-N-acetylmuramate--alanine ligase